MWVWQFSYFFHPPQRKRSTSEAKFPPPREKELHSTQAYAAQHDGSVMTKVKFTCSNRTIETLEKGGKYVQS